MVNGYPPVVVVIELAVADNDACFIINIIKIRQLQSHPRFGVGGLQAVNQDIVHNAEV
ncbi:hypothetical protein D3C71_2096190 [compost metagenome]